MGKRNINFSIWWPDRPRLSSAFWQYLIPHPGTLLLSLLLVGGLLWAQSVGALPLGGPQAAPVAASTGTIAYQGRLADSAGAPLTGTYNMIFRLYDAAASGTPLWEEQWTGSNGVRVSDGLFNVMLGSLTTMPQDIIAGHDQLFLGITVGTDDEMAPRVQLGSVPFAVQALTIPDGSVTTERIADGAVDYAKLRTATYHGSDNRYMRLQGLGNLTLSEFRFENVPAGEVVVSASLMGYVTVGASGQGMLSLEIAGTAADNIATHVLVTDHLTQLTLHGRVPSFAGGTLVIRILASTENAQGDLNFGTDNGDFRFGRRVTVIAGL